MKACAVQRSATLPCAAQGRDGAAFSQTVLRVRPSLYRAPQTAVGAKNASASAGAASPGSQSEMVVHKGAAFTEPQSLQAVFDDYAAFGGRRATLPAP